MSFLLSIFNYVVILFIVFSNWGFFCVFREKVLEYRDESGRLDQCSRLYDSSVSNNGFEVDASYIVQVNADTSLFSDNFDKQYRYV